MRDSTANLCKVADHVFLPGRVVVRHPGDCLRPTQVAADCSHPRCRWLHVPLLAHIYRHDTIYIPLSFRMSNAPEADPSCALMLRTPRSQSFAVTLSYRPDHPLPLSYRPEHPLPLSFRPERPLPLSFRPSAASGGIWYRSMDNDHPQPDVTVSSTRQKKCAYIAKHLLLTSYVPSKRPG